MEAVLALQTALDNESGPGPVSGFGLGSISGLGNGPGPGSGPSPGSGPGPGNGPGLAKGLGQQSGPYGPEASELPEASESQGCDLSFDFRVVGRSLMQVFWEVLTCFCCTVWDLFPGRIFHKIPS